MKAAAHVQIGLFDRPAVPSKPCFKCGRIKPLSDFYKHSAMVDGHLNKCKECTKSDAAKNYLEHRDQYAEYERKRFQDPARKKKVYQYAVNRRESRPEKYRARVEVGNALRDGRIERKPCEVCGSTKSQAHHDDYSKPLDVKWLCRNHHLAIHGKQAY